MKKNTNFKRLINLFILFIIKFNLLFGQPGSLDSSFNNGGIFTVGVTNFNCFGRDLAIQNDGKIVIVGYLGTGDFYFSLTRINSDGELDTLFGSNGVTFTEVGADDKAYSVVIQNDNKIVLGGSSQTGMNKDFAIVRYNYDGTLDTNFGIKGIVLTDFNSNNDGIYDIILQPDGKIVATGYSFNGTNTDLAIARYNPNGTLDKTFGTNGLQTYDIDNRNEEIKTVAIQKDGKIIVAGKTSLTKFSKPDYFVVRIREDGLIDSLFGTDGKIISDHHLQSNTANSIALQKDGKIVIAGKIRMGYYDFLITRFNSDGTIDSSFGNNGCTITDIGGYDDYGNSLLIQPDGKILVGGYGVIEHKNKNKNRDIILVRYNANGTLDNNFGTEGKQLTNISNNDDYLYSLVLQQDGRIVIGGYSKTDWFYSFLSVRYLSGLIISTNNPEILNYSMKIYPNPVKSNAFIEYNLNSKDVISLYLVDITGKVLKSFGENIELDVGYYKQKIVFPSHITPGYYLILLLSSQGKYTYKVFIK